MRLVFREVDRDKFDELCAGRKSVETRAATEKYRDVKAGTLLTVVCGRSSCQKRIATVAHYGSIKELLDAEGLDKILPGVADYAAAEQVYYSFPGYKDKIAEHGLVAWRLEPVA